MKNLLIIPVILLFIACKPQEKLSNYRKQAIDIAWLKVDKIDKFQPRKVKQLCRDLDKRVLDVEYKRKSCTLINTFRKSYFKCKTIAYIPITYQDVNKIKEYKIFGKVIYKKTVISTFQRNHRIIYDTINNDPELKKIYGK